MPIGIITDSLAVLIGGVAGALASRFLKKELQEKMTMIFGLCSVGMGIGSLILMENMPAVILSVILGTLIGHLLHLGEALYRGGQKIQILMSVISSGSPAMEEPTGNITLLVTAIVLFCASGTGIYGSIIEGMSGEHTILLAKSILDFFTAIIFACTLGYAVSLIAVPQAFILLSLYVLAGVIFPITTSAMINDFKACGGFILVATGFRILNLKMFPTTEMIPAMILVMPLSQLWSHFVTVM